MPSNSLFAPWQLQYVHSSSAPSEAPSADSFGGMRLPGVPALLPVAVVVSNPVLLLATARRTAAFTVCLGSLMSTCAHAAERVTLRNGFTLDCARHETVGEHVRFFTGNGSDFQELPLLQVANIESIPDPPKPPVPSQPIMSPSAIAADAVQHPELGFQDILIRAGAEHNIDVELLASVIHAESGYNSRAVSRAGARGLMQLMPSTGHNYGAHDLFKAEENIAAGTAFLDELLKRYHDNLALALAAYNAGPAAVERYHGVPPYRETRAYVTRVINEFYRRKLALGAVPSLAKKPATPTAAAPIQLASGPSAPAMP
jgi:hypothetical protein